MITTTINGTEYSIKNQISELTIAEFENATSIINDDSMDRIERYSKLFSSMGSIPMEEIDSFEVDDFFQLVEKFLEGSIADEQTLKGEMVKEIEVNGRTYRAYEETFKLNVKEMKLIERYIKNDSIRYIGDLMAIIFKDVELTNTEHYTDAHIRHKAKLFRENVTADIAMPYVGFFSTTFITNLQTYAKI